MLRLARPLLFVLAASAAAAQSSPSPTIQPSSPSIAGVWVLHPALTQKPDEIGFSNDWARTAGEEGGRSGGGGGRGRRGGSGSGGGAMGAPQVLRESADDSTHKPQPT